MCTTSQDASKLSTTPTPHLVHQLAQDADSMVTSTVTYALATCSDSHSVLPGKDCTLSSGVCNGSQIPQIAGEKSPTQDTLSDHDTNTTKGGAFNQHISDVELAVYTCSLAPYLGGDEVIIGLPSLATSDRIKDAHSESYAATQRPNEPEAISRSTINSNHTRQLDSSQTNIRKIAFSSLPPLGPRDEISISPTSSSGSGERSRTNSIDPTPLLELFNLGHLLCEAEEPKWDDFLVDLGDPPDEAVLSVDHAAQELEAHLATHAPKPVEDLNQATLTQVSEAQTNTRQSANINLPVDPSLALAEVSNSVADDQLVQSSTPDPDSAKAIEEAVHEIVQAEAAYAPHATSVDDSTAGPNLSFEELAALANWVHTVAKDPTVLAHVYPAVQANPNGLLWPWGQSLSSPADADDSADNGPLPPAPLTDNDPSNSLSGLNEHESSASPDVEQVSEPPAVKDEETALDKVSNGDGIDETPPIARPSAAAPKRKRVNAPEPGVTPRPKLEQLDKVWNGKIYPTQLVICVCQLQFGPLTPFAIECWIKAEATATVCSIIYHPCTATYFLPTLSMLGV